MREALERYGEILNAIADDGDFIYYGSSGKPVKKPAYAASKHPKKALLRKLSLAFGLSWTVTEPVLETGKDQDGEFFIYKCTATVTSPGGRTIQAHGSCSSRNPFFSKKGSAHRVVNPENIAMMAQTVALNRAIGDMTVPGLVSAEEMIGSAGYERTDSEPPRGRSSQPPREQYSPPTGNSEPPIAGSGRKTHVTENDINYIVRWVNAAREAGMKDDTYQRFIDKINAGLTVDEVSETIEWLFKHFPDQEPGI